jgi:hypothetical protein
MKKIILTEDQAGKLINKVSNVENPYELSDGRYHQKAKLDFNFYRSKMKYKGGEIDDIYEYEIDISFLIKIEDDIQGIKGLKIYDVRGPKQIETEITYFPWDAEQNGDEDPISEKITFDIPWRSIKFEEDYTLEYFGIGNKIILYLQNSPDEGLMVKEIEVEIRKF